jgi:3-oxoacyl-[acyl-carrier-protein] synthase-1
MAKEDVVVVAVGMMTAVGLSAAETAANVRAGTMRFTPGFWHDKAFEPFVLAEVLEAGLPDLEDGVAGESRLAGRERRMLRLATMPLRECCQPLAAAGLRAPLHLALPETETLLPLEPPALLSRLAKQTKDAFDAAQSTANVDGRAGGLLAVGRAAQQVREGTIPYALAGGVDTYRDSYILGTLDMEKRVKSPRNLDGFIPGEGAGFLLLAKRETAAAAGLTPLAKLSGVAEGFEEGHLYSDQSYKAEGLAQALQQLLEEDDPGQPIQEVYSSMTGERHWAQEWGVAFVRNKAAFAPDHGFHHPADCFGDTGAASGPVLVGLAALGMARGYRRGPALVYASSDRGRRAVTLVSSP